MIPNGRVFENHLKRHRKAILRELGEIDRVERVEQKAVPRGNRTFKANPTKCFNCGAIFNN